MSKSQLINDQSPPFCHPRPDRGSRFWIPAFAGMTRLFFAVLLVLLSTFYFLLFTVHAASPPIYSSSNYKMELLGFGQELALTSVVDSIPPSITAGPSVADVSVSPETSVTITWTTSKPSSSIVFYGSTTAYGSQFGSTTESVTSHSVTITGLTAGQTYHYKVRSVDNVGNIGDSADGTFSAGDITAPTISNLKISAAESTYVIIVWDTNENANSLIEYGADSTYGTEVGQSDESVTSHSVRVNGVIPSSTYHFRAKSKDQNSNIAYSSDGTFTTSSTPAIKNVEITDITLNSAVVRWQTNEKATTMLIWGKTTSYGEQYLDDAKTTNHTVRLTNLESGTEYHFRIRGTDASGLQLSSDDYMFRTVILPLITDVRIEDITDHSSIIRWTSSSKIDELIEYQALKSGIDDVPLLEKKTSGSVDLVTEHAHKLIDLDSVTTYRFRIYGKDTFGNQATSDVFEFTTGVDKEPPVVTNLKTDTALDLGSRDSVQVLVSYTTNESANGFIEYGRGAAGPYSNKSIVDGSYTMSKVIVVPKLTPGNSYHLRVVAEDRSGNVGYSDDQLVLAPQQGMTLLELILSKLGDAFGWMGDL